MKIYKLNKKNLVDKNLFELKLIKNKIYNERILIVKKILKLIYKFHTNNGKFLFLGTNKKINFFLYFLKACSMHSYIPENIWLNGIFSNFYVFKSFHSLNKNKSLTFLFNLKSQNFNLIIVCSSCKLKSEVLKSFKTPIIFLNSTTSASAYCFLNLIKSDQDVVYFLILNIISRHKTKHAVK
jgi:hypothetical protein